MSSESKGLGNGGVPWNQAGPNPTAGSYQEAIITAFASELNIEIVTLEVTFSKGFWGGYLSQVLFTTEAGTAYEGDVLVRTAKEDGNWAVENKICAPIERAVPFTHMEMSGIKEGHDQYCIISGMVNNRDIAYVNIDFTDMPVRVMVDPSHGTYACVRTGGAAGVKRLRGFSQDGTLIYGYNWEENAP